MSQSALKIPSTTLTAPVTVQVTRLSHALDLPLPTYATELSAGADILAAIDADITLQPLQRAMVPTGLCMAIPAGYEVQVRPRSGLAAKHGITLLNTPGTIDADYRGEVKVIMVNLSPDAFTITRGMRIAQLVLAPVTTLQWQEVTSLDETSRGAGGFGSTGLHHG